MKTLLFCSRYFIGDMQNHLSKKFAQQISAFEKIGFCVYYLAIENYHVCLFKNNEKINIISKYSMFKVPLISNFIGYIQLYKSLFVAIKCINKPDLLYCRSMFPFRTTKKVLKYAKTQNIFVMMEIPTYPPMNEYQKEKHFFRRMILKYLDRKNKTIAKYIDLFILIGVKSDTYFNKPALNIDNGIDVNIFPIKSNIIHPGEIHILALAAMAKWHGFDRLIEGVKNYYDIPTDIKIYVHLVGPDGDGSLIEWRKLIEKYNLSSYFIIHGPLYGQYLDEMFNLCDVGIASLALHRINISESSILKVREYTARGLPFIYSANDTAIPNDISFALQISNDDTPVCIKHLICFYQKCQLSNNIGNEMHQFALQKMTWEHQFSKILLNMPNTREI